MQKVLSMLPPVTDAEAYKPWFEQTEVWLPAMGEICRRHGLDAGQLARVREGSAIVFACGEVMIKLLPPFWDGELELDCLGLARVSGRLPVTTPELLDRGRLETWSYLLTRRIEGLAVKRLWAGLDAGAQARFCHSLGELMAALHALDAADLPGDWQAFVAAQRAGLAPQQRAYGMHYLHLPPFEAALDQALARIPASPRVLLHADLSPEHLLLSERGGGWELSGLLDFGDLMTGASWYEFAAPCAFFTPHRPELRQALIAGYGQAISADQLLAAQLLHRFCHLPILIREAGITPDVAAFAACYAALA